MTTRVRRLPLVAITSVATAVVLVPLVASAAISASSSASIDRDLQFALSHHRARNVIMLLGDGMGDSEITIARNYQVGANGRLALDRLPLTGEYTTYAVQKDNPSLPDYVTDSAASGSGWATGYKTYNGAISVTPDGKSKQTILERAKAAGYRTGDITTAEIEDATPAVLVSHVTDRSCYGPQSMAKCPTDALENGGRGSIAEQSVRTRPDVLMGGGAAAYNQVVQAGPYQGRTVLGQAEGAGYDVVTDAGELAATTGHRPILGLFADGNMDLEWTGPAPSHGGTPPSTCAPNALRSAAQPHLSDMTKKTLSVLDRQTHGSKKGFFLQIEGASIDKQDHAANVCGQIGETVEFDASVKLALDYQRSHPDTLVVVTADHGHTSQIVAAGSTTPGVTTTLLTHDGADMTVSYATADYPSSQQHTGTEVRIAAVGPHATRVLGITNQTDLYWTMRQALGL